MWSIAGGWVLGIVLFMSASFFTTVLSADLATAPDGRGVLVQQSGEGWPRQFGGSDDASSTGPKWASCLPNAEMVIRVAGQTVGSTVMTGFNGDMPEKRAFAALLLQGAADLVRELALDADDNGTLTDEIWFRRVAAISDLIDGGPYPPVDMYSRTGSVTIVDNKVGRVL